MQPEIFTEVQNKGIDYDSYIKHITEIINRPVDEKVTDEFKEKLGYYPLNLYRMNRIYKTFVPADESIRVLSTIDSNLTVMVITEGWCGDSAQIVPVIARLTALIPNAELKLIIRDQNPEIMDAYLTDGARSIPKLVIYNEKGEELFIWGSRPEEAQNLVVSLKAEGKTKQEWEEKLHIWYARNKGKSAESEIIRKFEAIRPVLSMAG